MPMMSLFVLSARHLILYFYRTFFIFYMNHIFKVLSSLEYKKNYLPFLDLKVLSNTNSLQIYRIEEYLTGIVMPVNPYRTSFNFMVFITEGHFEQLINFKSYSVSTGECLHIKQGIWTATQSMSRDVKGFILLYESDVFTQYLLMYGKQEGLKYVPHYRLELYDSQAILGSLILLHGELEQLTDRVNVYMPIFYSILSRLNYYSGDYVHNIRDFEIAHSFKELVTEMHLVHKSVRYYADKLCLSENYLNRCIKKVVGRSAKQFINEVNLQYAKMLLLNTTMDVSEIAYELQYPSPSYFAKFFRKETGSSPNSYRMQRKLDIGAREY